jgi:hypothetical protein
MGGGGAARKGAGLRSLQTPGLRQHPGSRARVGGPRRAEAAARRAAAAAEGPTLLPPPSLLQVEDLDLALRKKNKDAATSKLSTAQAKLDAVLASVL